MPTEAAGFFAAHVSASANLALSVDSVESHKKWTSDIDETQKTKMDYPIVGDETKAVANLYGVAVCPTIVFAYPRRLTMVTDFGYLGEAKLAARVQALETASERRGWKPPR